MKSSADDAIYFETQDRHVRQCLKEARVAMACWSMGLVYCTTVFVTMGYVPAAERPAEPPLVWGVPAWVFWGLFVPWGAQIALTCWFALRVLKDDEPYLEFPNTASEERDAR